MKQLMERYYNLRLFSKNESQIVEHIFAVLGNGVEMTTSGYMKDNNKSNEKYSFTEPKALSHIYPWSRDESFQPFRKYAGCRDAGFKEMAQYFIDCVKITPDSVDNIKDWKNNIHIVEDVLLNTPPMVDEFEGKPDDEVFALFKQKLMHEEFRNKHGKSIRVFDFQCSGIPSFVSNEIRQMWRDYDLGNDYYYREVTLDCELYESYPNIYCWLKFHNVDDGETVLIHWWW